VRPGGWLNALKFLPLMLAVGIGLCINQTRAVLEALVGKETEFVRTPKHGVSSRNENWIAKRNRAMKNLVPYFETTMGLYFAATVAVACIHGHFISAPFLCLFPIGFLYVGSLSVHRRR